jgi:tRNA-dihydrouridine synthase
MIVNLAAVSYQVSLPSKVTVRAGKTKRSFVIKALNVGAAQTFHVYAYTAGQGVRTTLTALP